MTTGVISGTATIPVPVDVVILTSGFLVIIGGSGGPPGPPPLSPPQSPRSPPTAPPP